MPCGRSDNIRVPIPIAHIAGIDTVNRNIDASGSYGDWVRGRILRNNVEIHRTAPVANNLNTLIPYPNSITIQNGDVICVQASFEYEFTLMREDCKKVPTPGFTFPSHISLSFQDSRLDVPNSGNSDIITVNFELLDYNLNSQGTIQMTGPKIGILSINDTHEFLLDGNSGSTSIDNGFGIVLISKNYNGVFSKANNQWVTAQVTDHVGFSSITPAYGFTNAILTENGLNYLLSETGDIIHWNTNLNVPNEPTNIELEMINIGGIKISELPQIGNPDGTDIIAAVNGGVTGKREIGNGNAVANDPNPIEYDFDVFSGSILSLPNNEKFPVDDNGNIIPTRVQIFTNGGKDDHIDHYTLTNQSGINPGQVSFTSPRTNANILIVVFPKS